ncbi:hypothetical protein ABT299_11555 [Spirillospora sp. NPDC000708]
MDEIYAELRRLTTTDSRELDRVCERVASELLEQGIEPNFSVESADFGRDPFLICADRYWRLRFLAAPTVTTAAKCARWLHQRTAIEHRGEIAERWALGYSFITRDTLESRDELSDATAQLIEQSAGAADVIFFAALYHAGKLRADFSFEELRIFLESSSLALTAGLRRDEPIFVALEAFAAFGSRNATTEHAIELFDRAWNHPARTRHVVDVCLNALWAAVPFPEQGALLGDRAKVAVELYPGDHIFYFRLATGQRLSDEHRAALDSIDTALRLLPATGNRGSHKLLQEQYIRERGLIVDGIQRATWTLEHERQQEASKAALAELRKSANKNVVRAMELVTVFAAVIAFAFGSPQFVINGSIKLHDRIWLLLAFGWSLTVFAFIIVFGTWAITRDRDKR